MSKRKLSVDSELNSDSGELSSNGHHLIISGPPSARALPPTLRRNTAGLSCHPSMSFDDGNIALLSGSVYFLVHRGVICRQSAYFTSLVANIRPSPPEGYILDGRPVLELEESPEDLALLLHTMYDGISSVLGGADVFHVGYVVLQLAFKYKISRLQSEALDVLVEAWPTKLSHWDHRMKLVPMTYNEEVCDAALPHPIAVINLSRHADIARLLPAAFYDLSRQPPSVSAAGFSDVEAGVLHRLSQQDLVALFQGRESASRFLSTFIVQALESRTPSPTCPSPRACHAVFERMSQEIVGDIGGLTSDPLRVMKHILTMTFPDSNGPAVMMLCALCADSVDEDVHSGREMLWNSLPVWFDLPTLPDWGI